ncbi:MAG: hypothetical protein H0W31_00195 [Actinobacteria bacterium]|nr:hypothetical protein [Actinomycetota bacterium]
MPRVNIPIEPVAELGTSQPAVTAGNATSDHYLDGGTDCIVECKNTSAGSLDVTFVTPYVTAGGIALADNAVTVAAGAVKLVRLKGSAVRVFYQQSGDSLRIWIDINSSSWEFRAYAI